MNTFDIFKKNIEFLPETQRPTTDTVLENVRFFQTIHRAEGVQMQVAREVSDDLLATDFSSVCPPEKIVWPHCSVELFFEDHAIPSVLMTHIPVEEYALRYGAYYNDKIPDFIWAMTTQTKVPKTLPPPGVGYEWVFQGSFFINVAPSMEKWKEFLTNGTMQLQESSEPITQDETECLRQLALLVMKVFIFASTPVVRLTGLTRKTMSDGKAGVKNRPERPSTRIDYMPRVIRALREGHGAAGGNHTFRGRCGVIHHYNHSRFVNRRGTWDYFPPLKDPVTGKYPKKTIRVIKPKTEESKNICKMDK